MKSLNIQMVWVTVYNIENAKDFFTNKLGLTLCAYAPEHNWAEFSTPEGSLLGVCGYSETCPIKPGDNAVICITVENADEAKKELEEHNVRCFEMQEVPGHVKMFLIQDESKNYYHIVEKLEE